MIITGDVRINPWLSTTPKIVLNLINKHFGYNWANRYGISPVYAQMIFGKYIHYLRAKNIENNPAGRKYASDKISSDIFLATKVKLKPEDIYSVLQNGNAYLLKDLTMPQSEQGPEAKATILKKKISAKIDEAVNRGSEVVDAVTNPFEKVGAFLRSPVTLGVVGLVAGYVIYTKSKGNGKK